MSFPPKIVLDVWKGNTLRRPFRIQQRNLSDDVTSPIDLTGSTLVFRVVWDGEGTFRKEFVLPDNEDTENGLFHIFLTAEETRVFPLGQKAKFEIERFIEDEQRTLIAGSINAAEWANDDTIA